MVVADTALSRYFPSSDWLATLGEIYVSNHSTNPAWSTLRICFTDMRRIDFIIVTQSAFQQMNTWSSNPLGAGYRVLFSRTAIDPTRFVWTVSRSTASGFSTEQFQEMTNQFWFKGVLSAKKVMRNDLLIGLHLALDMVRDCCVLGMLLRDRAEATSQHRQGGAYNHVVSQLNTTSHDYTVAGILDLIEQSSIVFDDLATDWSDAYEPRRSPIVGWIRYAPTLSKRTRND